jgi:GAF domain-containing protein
VVDENRLIEALSAFATTMVARDAIGDALYGLAAQIVTVLDVASAGVTLLEDSQLRFVTAINEPAAELERHQEQHQAGPCVDATRTGELVTVGDLRAGHGRWPAFEQRALELGILAVASIPMRLDSGTLGALNLYSAATRDWSADDLAAARVLADIASSYVVNASELDRHRHTAEQLQIALETRVVITQAKAIIAAERHISVDRAFELLRSYARSHNVALRSTADAVVRLGLRP